MDVTDWLRSLGLEQYAPAFEQNHISPQLLPHLTADDLRELGIASVGHRRQMLEAIADLAAGAGRASAKDARAPPPVAGGGPLPNPSSHAGEGRVRVEAERRQLTVMFCDLVGSTALSGRFDPEELREELRAYQNAVSGVVARYDGFVAKFMGDGVLVYSAIRGRMRTTPSGRCGPGWK